MHDFKIGDKVSVHGVTEKNGHPIEYSFNANIVSIWSESIKIKSCPDNFHPAEYWVYKKQCELIEESNIEENYGAAVAEKKYQEILLGIKERLQNTLELARKKWLPFCT